MNFAACDGASPVSGGGVVRVDPVCVLEGASARADWDKPRLF